MPYNKMMKNERCSGVLMHPTSLPGPYGIGDFGVEAYRFTDFLESCGAKLWQLLPLGPTGYGNSPYSSRSTFAGSILMISPDKLADRGYLTYDEITHSLPVFPQGRVDFNLVEQWKIPLLMKAAGRFMDGADPEDRKAYEEFCRRQSFWLDDYAAFAVATDEFDDSRWYSHWDTGLGFRNPDSLRQWVGVHEREIEIRKILQFFFYSQWMELKTYVNDKGILLIGDIPIFVAADSADTWVNVSLFKTDKNSRFSVQSGVPPDFFSATGQLWGSPLYDWDKKEDELMEWWIARIEFALTQTDIVRIDHFRGLEAYWEVGIGESTAINGAWVKAPGRKLFERVQKDLGEIPIIAEDLGVMTPDVEALRDDFSLPGMKIFQFSFDRTGPGKLNPDNEFLPHNYPVNCVAYTGTHDNDTTLGWYQGLEEADRDIVRRYLARSGDDIAWSMMRQIMVSAAKYAIFPMQDLLSLDSGSRMNTPSTVGEFNWSWRMRDEGMNQMIATRFREMTELYGRK